MHSYTVGKQLYVWLNTHAVIKALMKRNKNNIVTLAWVTGYIGSQGNEINWQKGQKLRPSSHQWGALFLRVKRSLGVKSKRDDNR